eukprot:553124-Pleurochrysis_carterae.AAC.2
MQTRTVSSVSRRVPTKSAFTIETREEDIRLHTLLVCTARRGGGKTVSISNLVRTYKERQYYDRVLLITPTFYSNRTIWEDIAGIKEKEDVFEPEPGVIAR